MWQTSWNEYISWKTQTTKAPVRIGNLNSPIPDKEIKYVVKKTLRKKTLEQDGFTVEFCSIFEKKVLSILYGLPENWREGNASQLLLWDQYNPNTKTDNITKIRTTTTKKNNKNQT